MQSPDRDAAPAQHVDTVPPVEAEDYPWAHAAAAQEDVPPLRPDLDPPKPDWHAPCEALRRDWNELIERVRQTGEPLFYAKGYAGHHPAHPGTGGEPGYRGRNTGADDRGHLRITSAISRLGSMSRTILHAAERHMGTHASLQRVAGSLGVPIFKVSDHLGWRQEADRLMATAETILLDGKRYGIHLDNMETGRARVEGELSQLRHVIREDGEYASRT